MKICIDAGHNYSTHDTGAIGNGLREQDITFAIADKLKNLLANYCDIRMSRNKLQDNLGYNLTSSLSERTALANKCGADLFISIHCNSAENKSATGTETYVYDSNSKCKELAENINNNICNKLGTTNRGVKTAHFAVLANTNMPAMLIELAFISNKEDAHKLINKQNDFAEAIAEQIIAYYNLKTTIAEPDKIDIQAYKNVYKFKINSKEANIDSLVVEGNNFVNLRNIVEALGGEIEKIEGKTVFIKN